MVTRLAGGDEKVGVWGLAVAEVTSVVELGWDHGGANFPFPFSFPGRLGYLGWRGRKWELVMVMVMVMTV